MCLSVMMESTIYACAKAAEERLLRKEQVMDNEQKVCGNCRFNKHDSQDFYCGNECSEFFTDYTKYGDSCEDWEEKDA